MSSSIRIAFAILLDDDAHNYARRVQLAISRRFNTIYALKTSPHITIKTPFEADSLEPFEKYLEELARDTEPFEIELEGIDCFEPAAIFIDVRPNPRLYDLHRRVIRDLENRFGIEKGEFEGENVRFHSTLAWHDISEEDFYRARDWLKDERPRFTFTVTTLALFYHLGEEAGWIVYRKATVG